MTHQPPPIPIERKKKNVQSAEHREDVYVIDPGILNVLSHAVGVEFSGSSCAVWVIAILYFQQNALVLVALLVTKYLVTPI